VLIRRGLPLLSLALLILGLELAVGTLSRSLDTIGRALGALWVGEEVGVSLPAFFVGLLLTGVGLAGLGLSGWSRVMRGRLIRGKGCPECAATTRRIRRRRWQRLLGTVLGEKVQRRECGECGWRGLAVR